MEISFDKTFRRQLLIKGLAALAIIVLAYYALDTGIHGLRYFVDYPENELSALLLLPHIGTGFIALMMGPWQFWKGLRTKYLRVHRWMGRIYISAVAISSLFGLYMGVTNDNLVFSTGITGLALAWIITGTLAYLAIRKGLVQEHKEWMIRNYVVTFAFVTFRIGFNYMLESAYSYSESLVMAWLCWVPQLFIADLLIQLNHSRILGKANPKENKKQEYYQNGKNLINA